MHSEVAEHLIKETRHTYDMAAKEFSDTRSRFWPELAYLGEHAAPGSEVLDIGCGNGRLLQVLPSGVIYTGVDSSEGLLRIAREQHPQSMFVASDMRHLPFPDAAYDVVFCLATLHHIPSRKFREQAAAEMHRILRPGGKLIVSVWSLWQPHHAKDLLAGAIHALWSPSRADLGDVFIGLGKEKFPRYVHGYTSSELKRLLSGAGFDIIASEKVTRSKGKHRDKNIVIIARASLRQE